MPVLPAIFDTIGDNTMNYLNPVKIARNRASVRLDQITGHAVFRQE